MVGQYHAERLLLGFTRLAHDFRLLYNEDRESFRSRLASELAPQLTRLRKGYNALRNALDYQLPQRGALPPPWLLRVWGEMTLAAYGIGYLLLRLTERHGSGGPGMYQHNDTLYLWDHLKWLNEREGLISPHRGCVGDDRGKMAGDRQIFSSAPAISPGAASNDFSYLNFIIRALEPLSDDLSTSKGRGSDDLTEGQSDGQADGMPMLLRISARLAQFCTNKEVVETPLQLRMMLINSWSETKFLTRWSRATRLATMHRGNILRIELEEPAMIRWSCGKDQTEIWTNVLTRDAGHGMHAADLPTAHLDIGQVVLFTFRWQRYREGRWEHDSVDNGFYTVTVS